MDRAEWLARPGNSVTGVAVTREDVEEWNYAWTVRLPGGRGSVEDGWKWTVSSDSATAASGPSSSSLVKTKKGTFDFKERSRLARMGSSTPSRVGPAAGGTAVSGPSTIVSTVAAVVPAPAPAPVRPPGPFDTVHARWMGKAPHSVPRGPKSIKWDTEWWRQRLCADPMREPSTVRYGQVYEKGCMDGLWHGQMMVRFSVFLSFFMQLS